MLTIKDLAVSKSLASKEMAAIHGGKNSNFSAMGGNSVYALGGGKGSVTSAVGVEANTVNQLNVAPVTVSPITTFVGFPQLN